MKKLLLLAILLCSILINAQTPVKPGLRAGLNLANFTNTNADYKTDFYVGGFVGLEFTRFYTLQPELYYSRQGSKGIVNDAELNYITITVANKFYPVRESGFNLMLGPSFAVKVSDNLENSFADQIGFDFLLMSGMGYEFPFGLGIEARFNFGLIDIFGFYEHYEYEEIEFEDLTLNKFFQFGLTYRFKTKK